MTFGKELKKIRLKRNRTQKFMALQLNMSTTSYYNIEHDILHWTSEVVAREDWIGLVERINAEFNVWTSKRARSSGGWLNVANERVEVIGNQYEHHYLIPELLEAEE